jgi:MOSC domain-containing protein YiiM
MNTADASINSASVGDNQRFPTLEELERRLANLAAPKDTGRVTLIVRKGADGLREVLSKVTLGADTGVPGDAWGRAATPNPETQLAVMQQDLAELIANGQPVTLFGDNLFLDLDLSNANLPTGSRVRAGGVLLEVTPFPHNGCKKFRARFGDDALRFVSKPDLRPWNLRGIYLRVIEAGEIQSGDPVEVVVRAAPQAEPT